MPDRGKLRDELRAMLESEGLSDEEFAALPLTDVNESRHALRWPAIGVSMAASVLLAVAVIFSWPAFKADSSSVLARVAEEVRVNHIRVKPLDVTASSYDVLRRDMPLLDFVLQTPRAIEGMGDLKLIGGRYCTLQGVMATQLVFEDSQGNRVTMYQAGYDASRFGRIPDSRSAESLSDHGLDIRVWQQEGVVLALAGAAY